MEFTQEQMEALAALAASMAPVAEAFGAAVAVAEESRPAADATAPIFKAIGGEAEELFKATYEAIEAAAQACGVAAGQIEVAGQGIASMLPQE